MDALAGMACSSRGNRAFHVLLALVVILAASAPASAADQCPSLVVLVSVDQFAYEYLERFDAGFSPQGLFRRCQRDGAWFTNCHHRHGITSTAPGHSVQLTGAYPQTSGIVDNLWFGADNDKPIYCVGDPRSHLVGPAAGEKPVSPRNLLCDTLGDRLKTVSAGRSKVFGVGLKDRAAILLAGHAADAAFWMSASGQWITSDFYRSALPPYVRSWNASRAADRYAGKVWNLVYERSRYRHPDPEDSFGERPEPGMQADFPHRMPPRDAKHYLREVLVSPFGTEMTLELARLIVADEELGKDEFPDLLAINLSSNDFVGHLFGPESLEVEDLTYRTDTMLGRFVDFVDERLEGRHWVLMLTADHGVTPIPERLSRRKIPARRNALMIDSLDRVGDAHQMLEAVLKRQLSVSDGQPALVRAVIQGQVYLRADHPALKGTRFAEAQRLTRDWLLTRESVACAVTREQILSGNATGPIEAALARGFHPRRSGDVLFCLKPYYIEGEDAASHGGPWECDSHVPLLAISFGRPAPMNRVPHGRFRHAVSPAAIAPTLAALLHVPPPAGCAEEPIAEALPP